MDEYYTIEPLLNAICNDDREEFCRILEEFSNEGIIIDGYLIIIEDYIKSNNRKTLKELFDLIISNNNNNNKNNNNKRRNNIINISQYLYDKHIKQIMRNTMFRFCKKLDPCSICLQNYTFFSRITVTDCGHTFHHNCIKSTICYSLNNTYCPLCRYQLCE